MNKQALRRRRHRRLSIVEQEDFLKSLRSRASGKNKSRRPANFVSNDGNAVLTGREFCPPHGCVSVCGRRREMEDATAIVPSFSEGRHFFAVYDGHGGSRVAFLCRERLHKVLAEELQGSDAPGFDHATWRSIFSSGFLRMDDEACFQTSGDGDERSSVVAPPCTDGSTAVVAVVGTDEIAIANCGDSRAVLARGGHAIPLTLDHKPDRADEAARIEGGGGRVIFWNGYRVLGVLATSRSIGDGYLKPYVIAEPEVTFSSRCIEDECLILGSDGLWDVVSNETACEVARRCLAGRTNNCDGLLPGAPEGTPAGVAATMLAKLAIARGSSDNISVVVVDLRQEKYGD
ncbi:hypothetical protein SUGI_0779750 [Cryptomeria japonica]|uniref:probable protein phosphatase 2C 8 n=1 Tax=Cryptomeria japonica TaxID=3369 RepID=UPI002414C38F|nr:probable protein phosphatase 2C 8 [Cryptomeria japonica]GLJ38301.1 hypothetical protein SUGI_0779750 [Cryptomeria japonica]